MQLWLNGEEISKAVTEYVEKHIIREDQRVTKVSGASGSGINCEITSTMEVLAK